MLVRVRMVKVANRESLKQKNLKHLKDEALLNIKNVELRKFITEGIEILFETGDATQLRHGMNLKTYPVHIEEFMFGEKYLNRPRSEIYPAVLEELIEINEKRGRVLNRVTEFVGVGGIGSAKCLGIDTPVIMFDGSVKKIQDITVGELVMSPDGTPRRVVNTTKGKAPLYRVDQKGGDSYVVNDEHILSLQYTDTFDGRRYRYMAKKGDIFNVNIQQYLSLPKRQKALLKGWRPDGVDFTSTEVYDPYLLGLWLGDGTSEAVSFTTMDVEIEDYLRQVAVREKLKVTVTEDKRGNKAKRYALSRQSNKRTNPLLDWLRKYDLHGNKHIPQAYLTSNREDRLKLLAGLLDTDGSLINNVFCISQKRKVLSDGIRFLCHSLGFRATTKEEVIKGTAYYRTYISGSVEEIPTLLPRKKATERKQVKDPCRWDIEVTPLGKGDYYGFELEGKDRLFLLGDFTVTHNTTTALYTTAYQLYVLSCYKSPHTMFQMDSTSEIVFIFQSLNALTSMDVDYTRFKAICEQSYYFTKTFPFNKSIKSRLVFPNRLEAKPIGSDGGSIGQNVVGGIIDEVNFMSVITDSKKIRGGGEYDQAKVIYEGVSRRIKSRFVQSGGMAGILCLVSSKNYEGEFTDQKVEEAKTDPSIYIYYKRVWEIKPKGTFSGKLFSVFAGDETRKARVLEPNEEMPEEDKHLVVHIPEEYRSSFRTDIQGALRDVAGIATLSKYPFITDINKIASSFNQHKSILSLNAHDFHSTKISIYTKRFRDPHIPRWVHGDLSLSKDSTGFACGYCSGFTKIDRGDGFVEVLPVIEIDFILEIKAPSGGEIQYHKIRELIYALTRVGLNIRYASFDSYQSADMAQILMQKGYQVGYISTDTSILPYKTVKGAMYDGRLKMPEHKLCQKEFSQIEYMPKHKKIDHPSNGSKDCSDAVAGVTHGLSNSRAVYAYYGIPVVEGQFREVKIKEANK